MQGRPGFDDDADPVVIMGGGEDLFFPTGTPVCSAAQVSSALAATTPVPSIPASCVVHRPAGDAIDANGPSATGGLRTDGLDLAQAAVDEGCTLVRTRADFEALGAAVETGRVDPAELQVLALFATQDIFNALSEESLIARGLVDESVPADAKETDLVLYGSDPGTPGYRPSTAPEMAEVATTVLEAHSDAAEQPCATVWEVEGTDNLANTDDAIGTLVEARYTDQMIGVAREALDRDEETTILTAADGNGGGLQVVRYDIDEPLPATTDVDSPSTPVDPGAADLDDDDTNDAFINPLDGRYGQASAPFIAEPDQSGQRLAFGIAWAGTGDCTGGVGSRVEGLVGDEVRASLTERFDNVDVYRVAYLTLFGEALAHPQGQNAPTREAGRGAAGTTPGEPDPGATGLLRHAAR